MKSMKMSRQSVYLLSITIFLLIFVFLFAFFVLIPSGQEYRIARNETSKHAAELSQFEQLNDDTHNQLKSLQEKHRSVVNAFANTFDQAKFIAENKKYFQNLTISKLTKVDRETPFDLYEVNATSKIDSPVVFYNFLDSLNKAKWIIGVNFPIHFQKEGEFIVSSFTMRVYNLNDDINESKTTVKKENSTAPAPLKVDVNLIKN
ncbi:MAG: hypothetical protein PHX13_02320 [Thiovulaceae bacterium]|nr:hypothetical protein [Sulfurimonadaceae bacterium]